MTNKEKYKQAFSVLHTSDDFTLEVPQMKQKNKPRWLSPLAAVFAACVILFATATTAYAANVGGIQRTIQLWLHGDQTMVTFTYVKDGYFEMDYIDSEGKLHWIGLGGTYVSEDGSTRPLTEEEILEELTRPGSHYLYNGSGWEEWYKIAEITDQFENDVCYAKLIVNGKPLYMTITRDNGYATSPNRYINPSEFGPSK